MKEIGKGYLDLTFLIMLIKHVFINHSDEIIQTLANNCVKQTKLKRMIFRFFNSYQVKGKSV